MSFLIFCQIIQCSKSGILYHMVDSKQFWVDSIYMLPPFLASAGYYKEALHQIHGYWDALYFPNEKLLAHRFDDETGSFARDALWGTGNGWAMAGLCRVIDLLPGEMESERAGLIELNRSLVTSVSGYIREDGTAFDILNDPASFVDVALPMFFAYSVYRGMYSGWLGDEYFGLAECCRNAAHSRIDQYGFIHDVCGAPDFYSSGKSPEAQALYILMHAARKKVQNGN